MAATKLHEFALIAFDAAVTTTIKNATTITVNNNNKKKYSPKLCKHQEQKRRSNLNIYKVVNNANKLYCNN